jgi:hypothetical protein
MAAYLLDAIGYGMHDHPLAAGLGSDKLPFPWNG